MARPGIARTFQNIALFKGMSMLDNLMTGRNLKMKSNFLHQALYWGPAQKEEMEHRKQVEEIIDFLEIQQFARPRSGGCPTGCRSASSSGARWRRSRTCCCSTSRWPA